MSDGRADLQQSFERVGCKPMNKFQTNKMSQKSQLTKFPTTRIRQLLPHDKRRIAEERKSFLFVFRLCNKKYHLLSQNNKQGWVQSPLGNFLWSQESVMKLGQIVKLRKLWSRKGSELDSGGPLDPRPKSNRQWCCYESSSVSRGIFSRKLMTSLWGNLIMQRKYEREATFAHLTTMFLRAEKKRIHHHRIKSG